MKLSFWFLLAVFRSPLATQSRHDFTFITILESMTATWLSSYTDGVEFLSDDLLAGNKKRNMHGM